MTKTIRSLNKGRARIWWVTHREDAKAALALTILVLLFLSVSHCDYQDSLAMERAARERAEARANAAEGFAPELPRVTFVLDARTRADLYDRLAAIAGGLDRERAEMRGEK